MQDDELRDVPAEPTVSAPPSTPDPYAVLHKYLDAHPVGQMFVIADEDMTAFYDQQYRHYVDGCPRCDGDDGGNR